MMNSKTIDTWHQIVVTRDLKSFFSINFLRGLLVLVVFICLFGIIAWYFEKRKNPEQFRTGLKGFLMDSGGL